MKGTLAILFTAFCILTLYTGCQKTINEVVTPPAPQPAVSFDSIFKCHAETAWDSTTIKNTLTGNWQWEFIKCYWTPEKANGEEYKNISLTFNADGVLLVKSNGQVTQTTQWGIGRFADGYYKVTTTDFVPWITGRILICKNRIIFYDSYVDGCDNYFVKN